MAFSSSRFTPQGILTGLALYCAMCTLSILLYCTVEIVQYPTPTSTPPMSARNHCVKATGGVRCRLRAASSVGRGSEDEGLTWNNSSQSRFPAAESSPSLLKARPDGWIGPKGYVTYKDKKPLKKQCNSCAVVNSAGRLLGTGAGEDIDAADCVIRMNGAPVDTFQHDVGARTTFRVIGHVNFPKVMGTIKARRRYLSDRATRSDLVVVWHYGLDWRRNLPERWCKAMCGIYHQADVYLASEQVMKRNEQMFYKELNISKSTVKLWMSTGWGTMLFALDVCERISVYGMIYEDFCSDHPNDTFPYHYFEASRTECGYYALSETDTRHGHKFLTEKAVFAKWAAAYGLDFYHPSWRGHLKGYARDSVLDTPFKRSYREHLRNKQLEERLASDKGTAQNVTSSL